MEQKRRILILTLNRPDRRNALTHDMCSRLVQSIEKAQEGHAIGAILLHAVGHVFCSGVDLDEAVTTGYDELAVLHQRLFSCGTRTRKPLVIAVNGAALGGGLGLVAQGHIVTASTGAAFGLPEIKVGFWPFIIYRSVESALGRRRTLELSLTGRLFYAQDALDWGLIHSACPPGEVLDRARGFAADLSKASPEAVELGLEYVHRLSELSPDEQSTLARNCRRRTLESADFQEGFLAFKSRRKPHWPSMPAAFYDQAPATADERAE